MKIKELSTFIVKGQIIKVKDDFARSMLELKANISSLSKVAFSGNYNDLINKPNIPEGVLVDEELSPTSTNPVQNKVINTALNGKASTSVATTSSNGLMSSSDKNKLDGIENGANKTNVDSSLNATSTNPVQNKVINTALNGKASTSVATTSSNGLMSSSDKVKLNKGGAYYSKDATTTVKNSTWTAGASLSLESGTYVVCVEYVVPSNATGRHMIGVLVGNNTLQANTVYFNNIAGNLSTCSVISIGSTTTVKVRMFQDSGSDKSMTNYIRALRIS